MQLSSRFLLFVLALGAPLLGASAVSAQAQAQAQTKSAAQPLPALPPPPSAPPVMSGPRGEPFLLGPDDVISLQVANHPEASSDSLRLSATGRVVLPTLGPLTIKNKTLEQAARAIAAAYRAQWPDAQVSVALVSARPRRATVLGAVARPGAIDLQAGWRVSEALAAAGGLKALRPDQVNATLQRLGGPLLPLDIATIYRAPEAPANRRVAVGDVINIVPIPLVSVTINGDVGAPGAQISRKAPRLLEALARAGGLKFASQDSEVTLLRDGKIIALDVAAAVQLPAGAANVELRDGDLLSVQRARLSVNVISPEKLVKAPGTYRLEGRSHFTRAIAAAGGLVGSATRIAAWVRRGNRIIFIDLARAITDPAADLALQNDDVIFVEPADGARVRLMGEIKAPAQYQFKQGTKISEAIAQAGGLLIAPAAANATVLRDLPDGRQIALQADADRLWNGNDLSQNITLLDGDVVWVGSRAKRSVAVTGQVARPDAYPLSPGDGLAELLRRAGGVGPLAAAERVTIYGQDNSRRVVDYSNFGRGEVAEIELRDGDRVQVPMSARQILVAGAVQKPDFYAIGQSEELTLSEALKRAGGRPESARSGEVLLLRNAAASPDNPEGYTTQRMKLDDGNKISTTVVQPGDMVLVAQDTINPATRQWAADALAIFRALSGF